MTILYLISFFLIGLNPVSSLSSSQKGFWEYDKVSSGGGSGRLSGVIQSQPEPPKSVQNKAKREEQAVMKLFSQPSQSEEDEFSQWCSRQLNALHSNVDSKYFYKYYLKNTCSVFSSLC